MTKKWCFILASLLFLLGACGSPPEGIQLRVDAKALEGVATIKVFAIKSTLKSGELATCGELADGTYKVDKANFDVDKEGTLKIDANESKELILNSLVPGEKLFVVLAYESKGGAKPTIALFGCKEERVQAGKKVFVSIGLTDFQGKQ